MGEIRLICPGCGAEYRVADTAIPAAGRDVECSSCGKTWFQTGTEVAENRDKPDLNRPLPDSVLSVLREEAELARRQRAGDDLSPMSLSGAAAPLPDASVPDSADWPATTVTGPQPIPTEPGLTDPLPAGPAPSRHIHRVPHRPTSTVPPHEKLEETVTRTTPHAAPPEPESNASDTASKAVSAAAPDNHAYRRGFGWAVGIAAAFLLLYAAAPRFDAARQPGAALISWRMTVDEGRVWLQDRISSPFGAGDGNQ